MHVLYATRGLRRVHRPERMEGGGGEGGVRCYAVRSAVLLGSEVLKISELRAVLCSVTGLCHESLKCLKVFRL